MRSVLTDGIQNSLDHNEQKKYNMGDCRYLPRDTATTVTVERITVVLEGPSCLLCLPSHLIYDRLCEEATAT